MKKAIKIFDIPVHPWTMEETIQEISYRMDMGLFTQHTVVNVAKLVTMRKDATLSEAVINCDIINIDGMGIVWAGRFLGLNIPERVTGIDLFFRLLEMASTKGEPVYLLGAKPEVVKKTVENLRRSYKELKIAGWHHGYFWENEDKVVKQIRDSGATMLFVAITSPQKERFIHRWRDQLGVKFAMGVGGTFDIIAGKTKRAPKWMQNMGLEWFYRIIQEPGRMWKRYLTTNIQFLCLLFKYKYNYRKKI